MDDMVTRQDAITAHCELCGDRGKCNCDICPDIEVFQLLPPAQQAAGDTISRCELFNRLANVQTIADAYAVIQGMPASQQKPEWAQKVEEYRKSAPSYVQKPLAWALYQTWKEYDERLFNHSREERRTDE